MENQQPAGEAQNGQKPFYKKWWGVVIIILFLPIFAIWYIWAKTKWNAVVKGLATLGVILITFIALGSSNSENKNDSQNASSQSEQKVAVTETKDGSTDQEKINNDKQLSPEEIAKKEAEEKAMQEALSKPHFADGNFQVGTDIQPGTYRTRKGSSGCYYARLRGFSGSLGDIISNENTYYPAVVTIDSTDKGFKSSGCGTWTQDLSAITSDQTVFNDGILIVGTDVLPGTYKSSGGDGCYYARLKGFTGSMGSIIANENTDTSAIVTISPTDKGFKSSGCGTWTKIK